MKQTTNFLSNFKININENWQNYALCSQADPDIFFPEKGGSLSEAKSICKQCKVRYECLNYALNNNINYGIWGGASERERRYIKKARTLIEE
jgi:WhiB family redox-sensing transcriptional regulator